VGVVVKGRDQHRPDCLTNLGVTLLAFGKPPENAHLAGGQLLALLDKSLFPFGQGALRHAKHTCTIRWLGTPVTFSGVGALKVSVTSAASHFSSVVFVGVFLQL
jgi:hypothetical protein